jgi:hypothetical protein
MNLRPSSLWLSVAALFSLLIALGCGSSSSANKTAQLRLMDASPTQQSINLLVDNATIQTGIVSQSASGYTSQRAGNHTLVIEAFGTSTPLVTQNVSLTANANYTVLAVPPSFGSSQLSMSLLTDDNSTPATGNFKLRIINASPDFGNLDAYITAPGAGISGARPSVPNLAFQAASSYQTLPAGNYEVYFSVAGQQVISVDSGQFTFSSGQVRTLVLLDNFGSGFTSAFLADAN